MKSNKTTILAIIIFLFIVAYILSPFLSTLEISMPNDYARITDMEYKAIVVDEPNSEGKIVVTERITYDIHAASKSNPFYELWRDLCEDTIDGVKVHYKVNSVKQVLPDGAKVPWQESTKLYWNDSDYESWNITYGPEKWYHSEGPYNEDYQRYECVFFYVDAIYREKITFEIEYEMYNAVLRYNDCSDLYIAMYSGNTIKHLNSFKGEILIPNEKMPKEGNYKITTYGTNSHTFPVVESKTKNAGYHTISFDLTKEDLQFKSYNQFIELDLVSYGEDKHVFSENASQNYYYYDDVLDEIWEEQETYLNAPSRYKAIKKAVFIGCIGLSVIIIISSLLKTRKYRRKMPYYSTKTKDLLFRDIPEDLDPKFASELVFCKDKKKPSDAGIYSAILLSLARKGYVKIEETLGGEISIQIIEDTPSSKLEFLDDVFENIQNDELAQKVEDQTFFNYVDSREPLTKNEEYYLDLVKRHAPDGFIYMSTLQNAISADYDYIGDFIHNIKKTVVDYGVRLKIFQKANYTEPKEKLKASANASLVFGLLSIIALNIIGNTCPIEFAFGGFTILGIAFLFKWFYIRNQSNKYILLTEYGEEEYKKWRGLYNFLKSDTLINEKTVIELPLWEKYLVYATAFGISEKVINAIKIHCVDMSTDSIINIEGCHNGRFYSSGRAFHSSVRTSYRHSTYRSFSNSFGSSGGYGSFGYGGGGRGGGGGGGGH